MMQRPKWAPVPIPTVLLLIQLPDNASGKAAENVPVALVPAWKTWLKFLVPDISLALCWLL